jgi:predicted  nucleic acid-binding Zn-ribbon protein
MASMDDQLEILLQIQDLKAKRKDLQEVDAVAKVQEEEFHLDIEEATAQLDAKIAEVVEELEPTIRSRYKRLAAAMDRVVVPAINGMCYGCFVAVPTAIATDPEERAKHKTCAHCGRFLYFVD